MPAGCVRTWRLRVGLMCALLLGAAGAVAAMDLPSLLRAAGEHRQRGNLRLSTGLLESARDQAGAACPAGVLAELGVNYLLVNRLPEAESHLVEAYRKAAPGVEAATYANDLGALYAASARPTLALPLLEQAIRDGDPQVRMSARLNRARLAGADRLATLQTLAREVDAVDDPVARARYRINIGAQARSLGNAGDRLAYTSLNEASQLAAAGGQAWLQVQALNELAQLYEDRGRPQDALVLTDDALARSAVDPVPEMLMKLHWRRARVLRAMGRESAALEAFQRTVEHLEAIRQDIPITYVDGVSSFRSTFEPIYLGLAELLIKQAGGSGNARNAPMLVRARQIVERVRQTELQDYLGDRCGITALNEVSASRLAAGSAVLSPVLLEHHLVLLLETDAGIDVRQVEIEATRVRNLARAFAASVRSSDSQALPQAQALHALLIAPIEALLAARQVKLLTVVPDGPLRLVPMAALHDGTRYLVEKYALATATGTTEPVRAGAPRGLQRALLAGMSTPGPVSAKLSQNVTLALASTRTLRGQRSDDGLGALALPGVAEEIRSLSGKLRADRLLDAEFTVERFRKQVSEQPYEVIHIASHAVFSANASESFVLAFDDVISLDLLHTLLREKQQQQQPIELLTLSACQTAEGDDRAPLGLAGAALRAQARSALGSLWPVDDQATKDLMIAFYDALAREGNKPLALQKAQRALLAGASYRHPFFWAAFVLTVREP